MIKKKYRCLLHALHFKRRSDPVAIDSVYCDTPAIDDGSTSAQFFVGTKTLTTGVYGMKSDKQFVSSLEDNVRQRGAIDSLTSDSTQY